MAKQNTIRVGLVGVGSWARYGHIPALKFLPEYEIVAVASGQMARPKEIAKTFEIPHAFDEIQQLLTHSDLDLVVVLPPASQHAAIVESASWQERTCTASGR